MTARNLARHAENENAPFWKMLRTGSDAFAKTRTPPAVAVCDHQYIFSASAKDLDPAAACPASVI
jgi:murein L,D-transpeptidase YafK